MSNTSDEAMQEILVKMRKAKTKKERQAFYSKYLRTDHWLEMRETIGDGCSWTCSKCSENKMTQVHHLSYARLGNERLTDLIGLCGGCHVNIHKKKKHKKGALTKKGNPRGSKMLRDLIDRVDELEETISMLTDKISHLI